MTILVPVGCVFLAVLRRRALLFFGLHRPASGQQHEHLLPLVCVGKDVHQSLEELPVVTIYKNEKHTAGKSQQEAPATKPGNNIIKWATLAISSEGPRPRGYRVRITR